MQEITAVDITKWKMGHDDLALKNQVGSGQFGVVMLAYLKREATSCAVTEYISKQQKTPNSNPCPQLVAVKRFRGETLPAEGLLFLPYNCALVWLSRHNLHSVKP